MSAARALGFAVRAFVAALAIGVVALAAWVAYDVLSREGATLVFALEASGGDAPAELDDAAARRVALLIESRLIGYRPSATHEGGGTFAVRVAERGLDDADRAAVRARLALAGTLALVPLARDGETDLDLDLASERARLAAWLEAHPGAGVAAFAAVERDAGGPVPRLVWLARGSERDAAAALPGLAPPRVHAATFAFDQGDFDPAAWSLVGDGAAPRLACEPRRERARAFAVFVELHAGRVLAVVVDGRVVATEEIDERTVAAAADGALALPLGLARDDAAALVDALRSGPLPAPLRFVRQNSE